MEIRTVARIASRQNGRTGFIPLRFAVLPPALMPLAAVRTALGALIRWLEMFRELNGTLTRFERTPPGAVIVTELFRVVARHQLCFFGIRCLAVVPGLASLVF